MARSAIPPARAPETPAYRAYVLAILLVTYLFSLIDRQVLAVLIEPIRRDLGLSDTQLGLLSGLAFGLLYATMAIPLARLGDRWSRRNLIALSVGVWSLATAACGLAGGFAGLFAARVLVGTGEAGASPASQALIADYFPPRQRATALGIYSMGIYLGAGLGLVLGGWLFGLLGWRGAFFAVALPGLAVAALFQRTVREPSRGRLDEAHAFDADAPSLRVSLGLIWSRRPLLFGSLALGLAVYASQSTLIWLPAFLARFHGLGPAAAGAAMGPAVALPGMIGVASGGWIADRLDRRFRGGAALLCGSAMLLAAPAGLVTLFAASVPAAMAGLACFILLTAIIAGPTFGLILNQAPSRIRGFAASIAGLIAAILGHALGPSVTGILSDAFARAGWSDPLRWGLAFSLLPCVASACCYIACAHHLRRDRP